MLTAGNGIDTQAAEPPPRPIIPDRVEDLGISRSLVSDLILRYLWLHGSATLTALHDSLKLSFPLLETLFHQFRQQQLLEVKGMVGNDYAFTPDQLPAAHRLAARATKSASTWARRRFRSSNTTRW